MRIDLHKIGYAFTSKPLLIGGKAMEYYGLRKAGADIDFVVSLDDHDGLMALYPDDVKDIHGDIGVCVSGFELWNRICLFGYDFLRQNALEEDGYLVTSVDKLIFLKAIAMRDAKYLRDLQLLAGYATDVQYGKKRLPGCVRR